MKIWKSGLIVLWGLILTLLLMNCEKTCLTYTCQTYDENGEITYVNVNGSNANVYGMSRCHCVDEVNRYVRR